MLEVNFNPFKNIETNRLLLRRVLDTDYEQVISLRGNPKTMQYIPRPLVKNKNDALEHIAMIESKIVNNEGINWAITIKEKPELIGIIGLFRIHPEHYRAEIGYMLLPEFQNQGIISESINAVLDYGFFKMNLHSIEAIIDPRNISSERVLQKNGFNKEAHFIENEYFDGKFIDSVVYSLLKRNYKNES
jgi:ribosomal-protein-alanine N-acetyltransferase